jgi:AraC-like DNA-binding protein
MLQETGIYKTVGSLYRTDYTPPDVRLLRKLLILIEEDFRRERDVEVYAQRMGFSITYLNKLTKAYLMETVYEVIQTRLLQEASFLLKDTILSVKQISYELGYCDPSYFCKWFKQRVGMTPKVFRSSFK